jgi:hypothetical protein
METTSAPLALCVHRHRACLRGVEGKKWRVGWLDPKVLCLGESAT